MNPEPPPHAEDFKAEGDARVATGWRRLYPVFWARADDGWEVTEATLS